jgi:hypothetical protein
MKRMSMYISAVLCFAGLAFAQHDAPAQPQDPTKTASATPTADVTIRGCISGGQRFTLMQADTGDIYALSGNTSKFASVQGKLIEISATEFSPQAKTGDLPRLEVSDSQANNVRVIADKCPIHAHPEPSAAPISPHQQHPQTSPSDRPYTDPGTAKQTPPNVDTPNVTGDTGAPSPGTGNPPPQR